MASTQVCFCAPSLAQLEVDCTSGQNIRLLPRACCKLAACQGATALIPTVFTLSHGASSPIRGHWLSMAVHPLVTRSAL
jgi:hypothetical protein